MPSVTDGIFELIVIIALVVILAIIVPLAAIWSVNTLFGTAIAYGFKTWCAALILSGIVGGSKTKSK